ncbi:hypothetical protein A2625_04100 [candidate division WOR-1 bacterium RIFCSPHIGHO2_01_FULL_53_15]|uniref:SLH domain-containing protein n=1 Tax=candidate division WOR-1 bacterium RIFCSPHIGHO2_01_FULL_53_15 TaxID=1802564 RepID=A0A1F4Q071_UNCSA|nr:MAG: hypothetical protein A2625_04100 [candidate division WOR-1 bacterium RIFCSPHIGHO2_01_FULL_53_15]OGC12952.1 MAG: hypothetical protein A3D23_05130 [candidate division WOR-1 bacterium RIFCSPHIGHO2_02_FULL_53_26]
MRKWLLALPLVFLAAAACLPAGQAGAQIRVSTPQDKFLTFDEVVMLRGRVAPAAKLTIENIPFKAAPDGAFAVGLVLKPGKNLVLIRAGEEEKRLRVLRLITYPDVETAYEGKKHWARGQIVYLATLGVIEGYPDGSFSPGNPVTRGEFATWLAKVKGLPTEKLTADVFFDVPKEHWRAPDVKAVTDAGYMAPYSKETFGLDDPISRAEAADLAVKTEGLAITSKLVPLFRDVPQEGKGAAPIYIAKEKGLVIGVSKDLPIYDPTRAISRAEAATLISRFASAQGQVARLADFETGYTGERFCGLNVAPVVVSFKANPARLTLNQTTSVKLRAEIASRESFAPISKVKVDLSAIGGVPDAEMYDDGERGDEIAGDLVYSLNISYQPKQAGEKRFEVTAVDRLGWPGQGEASLLIVE